MLDEKRDFDSEFEEHWKPLLLTDGEWDEEKIKNEMSDLVFIYKQISEVYCHITGGQLSKPMYYADVIIRQHDDAITKAVDEALQEYKDAQNNTNDNHPDDGLDIAGGDAPTDQRDNLSRG